MATWVLGDIHGCAEELAELLERIAPGPRDAVVACGDLLHRGPDPAGVVAILRELGARFVLGNHEMAILRRLGRAPERREGGADALVPPEPGTVLDLAGDGRLPLALEPEAAHAVVGFLLEHSGCLLRRTDVPGSGPTADGREWVVVHAGLDPDLGLEGSPIAALTSIRRVGRRRRAWWYETWQGPELVLFGHTPSSVPRAHRLGGRLLALGLDTGCVFGGRLTAYSPELDRFVTVRARRAWA